jgi:hypothetical protein
MRVPGSLRWIALALLGLVIAAAIALAASRLASQQIGIASESVSAGKSLAPPVTSVGRRQKEDRGKRNSQPQAGTEGAEQTEPTEPGASTEAEPAEPSRAELEAPAGGETTAPPGREPGGGDDGTGGEGRDD